MVSARIMLYAFSEVKPIFLKRIGDECYDALPGSFPQLQIESRPLDLPEDACVENRQQYRAGAFLDVLEMETPKDIHAIGFTHKDLFTPRLNFIFGVAQQDRNTIVALLRLQPQFYGEPENPKLYELRVIKETLHELGHVFRLGHCTNHCVMRFSNRLSHTDLKPAEYCEDCYTDLQNVTQE